MATVAIFMLTAEKCKYEMFLEMIALRVRQAAPGP